MRSSHKGFLLGAAISLLVIVSFLVGGLADRVFVLKPVDWLLRSSRVPLLSQGATGQSSSATPLNADERSTVDIANKASESVVTVAIKRQRSTSSRLFLSPFSPFELPRSSGEPQEEKRDIGTGFVVTTDGLIVTNKHVVDSSGEFLVIDRENNEHRVLNIYRDPANDLAILKVEGLQAPQLELGDSDALKVGQQVIAIGTALGEFRHTVTTGVVSGLGRGIEAGDPFGNSVEALENVIQTDAAINPGNSGGPLLDSSGKVIGVNVAVSAAGQNIGFAIPINVIKASLENFNQTGQFDRPILGIRYQIISERAALANEVPQGAYVVEVIPDSAASEGQLQAGDILTEFDGQSLKNAEIPQLLNKMKIGQKVKLKYWRSGETKEVEVTLRSEQPAANSQ
ncbi:trypsin-like peptidase domain-containing protein [Patescibacteria group bacterium]|mgnify:CR=1 FL=1|nr:trypsin-like peptidase domain-containing protein [Patescibacteria group bacterium]